MASIKIDLGEMDVEVNISTFDGYSATPLGCHAGLMGNVHTHYKFKDKRAMVGQDDTIMKIMKEQDGYRKIMDSLVSQSHTGYGTWTMGGNGSGWYKKGHWIMSCPWKKPDYSPTILGTGEFMDLIQQFCANEPETYGYCCMTVPTDCGAHSNNAGFPATRTLVWVPPFAQLNKDTLKTRVSGVYSPRKEAEVQEIKPSVPVEATTVAPTDDDRGLLQRGETCALYVQGERTEGSVPDVPDEYRVAVRGESLSPALRQDDAGYEGRLKDLPQAKTIADLVDKDILEAIEREARAAVEAVSKRRRKAELPKAVSTSKVDAELIQV